MIGKSRGGGGGEGTMAPPRAPEYITKSGFHIADVLRAAISSPWDFPPKVLVIFFKVPWERGA